MNDKQIYAALEISDHEVRMIIGEFFNTRFNIIKVERIPCTGLTARGVEDPEAIKEAINKACIDAEKMISAKIEKVILGMPSANMKRYSLKSSVMIQGFDGTVTIEDIRAAIRKAEQVNIGKNYALIQTVCVKYTVNGISSRRIPIGEKAGELTIDIDLLCADRRFSFDLVNCVEQTGLHVMDLYLDIFAVAKEAALFEQAVDQNVIVLKMERENTTLGLITHGRINSAMMRTSDKKRKKMDYKKELQEIIDQVESAKNHLAEVTEAMDYDDKEVDSLDEALDALDDAIDIMTDSLEEEE